MLENAVELEREAQSGWNLGTDQKLLAALGKFSTSLGEKTQSLVGKVDVLSSDTVEVECKLRNTFNDFLMLADSQFIENVSFDEKHQGQSCVRIIRSLLDVCLFSCSSVPLLSNSAYTTTTRWKRAVVHWPTAMQTPLRAPWTIL